MQGCVAVEVCCCQEVFRGNGRETEERGEEQLRGRGDLLLLSRKNRMGRGWRVGTRVESWDS